MGGRRPHKQAGRRTGARTNSPADRLRAPHRCRVAAWTHPCGHVQRCPPNRIGQPDLREDEQPGPRDRRREGGGTVARKRGHIGEASKLEFEACAGGVGARYTAVPLVGRRHDTLVMQRRACAASKCVGGRTSALKSTRDLSSAAEPALAAKWSAVHPPDAVRDMEGRRGDREGARGWRGREGERERGLERGLRAFLLLLNFNNREGNDRSMVDGPPRRPRVNATSTGLPCRHVVGTPYLPGRAVIER